MRWLFQNEVALKLFYEHQIQSQSIVTVEKILKRQYTLRITQYYNLLIKAAQKVNEPVSFIFYIFFDEYVAVEKQI